MLKRFLELPSGNPSRGTFNRVFAMPAPARLESALSNWVRSLVPDLEGEHIAIDGKSIRGSNKPTSHSFVHMVSAFACGNGITLAQVKVDEKSNEITAIPKLLDMLDIRSCTISIDAMGARRTLRTRNREPLALGARHGFQRGCKPEEGRQFCRELLADAAPCAILKVYKEESRTRMSYRLMMFKAAMDPEFPLEVLRTVFA